jgi:putative nucleotidyltransferase with HDIG domain
MQSLTLPSRHAALLTLALDFFRKHDVMAWLVGGYVRDLLLGLPSDDIDVAVDGPALDLARELADQTGGAFVTLDEATESARIVWKVSGADTDRLPVVDVVRLRAPSIDADLRLRDITINALALPLAQAMQGAVNIDALLDPTGGLADLKDRHIRLGSPTSLADDPLRLLRLVRFAAQLDFSLAPATDAALRRHARWLDTVAPERVRDELLKLLETQHAAPWLAYLDEAGLLTRILPELEPARACEQPKEHFLPVLAHLFETVCAWEWLYRQIEAQTGVQPADAPEISAAPHVFVVPAAVQVNPSLPAWLPYAERIVQRMEQSVMAGHRRYAFLKLAALLHDVAKPATKQITPSGRITFYGHAEVGAEMAERIGQRLRLSRDAVAYIRLVVRDHMRPGQLRALGPALTRRAIYRLLRDTGDAAPDVLLHSLCDHLAARGPELSLDGWVRHITWTGKLLEEAWGERQAEQTTRLITGNDVINVLEIKPGPLVGHILAAVQEAQFVGEVRTRDEALALARRFIDAGE